MKRILSIALLAGIISIGCTKEEEELPVAAPVSGGANVVADPLAGAKPDQAATPTPLELLPKPPETLIDFNAAERPQAADGKVMDDLAYLNHLVFNINEGRTTYVSDNIPVFNNDAERQAYEAALAKARQPITDINELVRLKVIKALPPAPAGQRYTINATSGKVELVSQ